VHQGHCCNNVIRGSLASYVILAQMLTEITVTCLAILALIISQVTVVQQCLCFVILGSTVAQRWEHLETILPNNETHMIDNGFQQWTLTHAGKQTCSAQEAFFAEATA
jgi:hypothetical protein